VSLNIKNEETHRLVQELAAITGESMTTAVTEAVRERLNRVKSKGMADRIMKLAKQSAPLWKEPYKSIDHGDLLYDENGLPK
jgi:antitoxin VapB